MSELFELFEWISNIQSKTKHEIH